MTEQRDAAIEAAFANHDAFEARAEGYRVRTTAFDGAVRIHEGGDASSYVLTVRAPTLSAATADQVGPTVADGWFETLKRRLAEAPTSTRVEVALDAFGLRSEDEEVVAVFECSVADPHTAAAVAKTFTEYVEGTYVEGVVPGYEYEGVVAELLGRAASGQGEGDQGGTPL